MKTIPYGHQWIAPDDIRAVNAVLRGDWVTQGPKIREFENLLAQFTRARYAVCVSSGTAALHLACLAIGIKPGIEVITSPLTFVASANCILYCGGKPIFADIQPDTANIDPGEIEKKITPRTRAIIPVDYAGHPCDLEAIHAISRKHNLLIVEDGCHALGATYKRSNIGCGKYSDLTVFSFHPVKSITTGEGGAIVTNRKDLYEKILLLRNHGITRSHFKRRNNEGEWYYEMQELGFNYRITDFQSALGISQLKKIRKFIRKRREMVKIYSNELARLKKIDLPVEKKDVASAWHLYPIRLKEQWIAQKNKIFSYLRKNGIGVQVHYIPVYWQYYYQKLGYKKGICPQAERFYQKEMSLPLYPAMRKKELKNVIRDIFRVFSKF